MTKKCPLDQCITWIDAAIERNKYQSDEGNIMLENIKLHLTERFNTVGDKPYSILRFIGWYLVLFLCGYLLGLR